MYHFYILYMIDQLYNRGQIFIIAESKVRIQHFYRIAWIISSSSDAHSELLPLLVLIVTINQVYNILGEVWLNVI